MSNLGFVGLGIMGRHMAANLIKGGHTVFGFSRSGVPAALVSAGCVPCENGADVARKSEVIITMVPDTPDVEKALFSPQGIAAGLTAGKVVIDMSSIAPLETRQFAERIAALGCGYADAPVSGGEVGARTATLTIMVGADGKTFEAVRPVLALMGKNITLVGPVGTGQICKIANQIIVALNIEAVAEALVFASKAGADPETVRQALMGGFASSKVLEVHGERIIKRTFEPGFRVELHQKDLNLALAHARQLGVSLPNTASTQMLFNACQAQGGGKWDHAAMVRALELLANHQVGTKG